MVRDEWMSLLEAAVVGGGGKVGRHRAVSWNGFSVGGCRPEKRMGADGGVGISFAPAVRIGRRSSPSLEVTPSTAAWMEEMGLAGERKWGRWGLFERPRPSVVEADGFAVLGDADGGRDAAGSAAGEDDGGVLTVAIC
ncbi:hypothetical protein ACLOJK_036927 [Asimina triloba]